MNQYTPDNRPDYPWVKVEDELPNALTRLLAIWTDGTHKMLSTSYCFDGWYSLEHPHLNNGSWYVIYWQYQPALPE